MNPGRIVFILFLILAAVPVLGQAQTPWPPVEPAYKVGVTQRVFTPPEPYNWHGTKTHAKLTLLPGVEHYTFLATCADVGRHLRHDLCMDAAGIDRDAVHAQTARMALDFFAANLR